MKHNFALGLFLVLTVSCCFNRNSDAQNLCTTGAGVCVLTWHNDNYRAGANLGEGTLTFQSVSKHTFGQLCSVGLDGQVYAQPLVVTGTNLGQDPVVYAVTMNDTLYADGPLIPCWA